MATSVDRPVVEPHEEVCARILGFGAENGLALCGVALRGIPKAEVIQAGSRRYALRKKGGDMCISLQKRNSY